MTVAAILAKKGRQVITMGPQQTLAAVCETLASHKIGAVVLIDGEGAIAGILSEKRNVLGLMPHPERVVDQVLGGTDGRKLFQSLIETLS